MNFVLVHGAYHGAWCWDHVRQSLMDRGHGVVAVDLPIGDPTAGAREYAAVISGGARGLSDVVVVAHSMAGVSAPLVTEEADIRLFVYLAALLPRPGHSLADIRAMEPVDSHFTLTDPEFADLGDGTWRIGDATARELFFHDVPEETASWAVGRLRPQAYRFMTEVSPLEAWPDIPSVSILCRDDRAVNPQWSRDTAKLIPGMSTVEIPGGHSPHLARPDELTDLLIRHAAGA